MFKTFKIQSINLNFNHCCLHTLYQKYIKHFQLSYTNHFNIKLSFPFAFFPDLFCFFEFFFSFLIFYFSSNLFCISPLFSPDHFTSMFLHNANIYTHMHAWIKHKCKKIQKMTKNIFFSLCFNLFSHNSPNAKNKRIIYSQVPFYFDVIEYFIAKIKYSPHDQFVALHTQFHTKFFFSFCIICCHMPNSLTDDFQLMIWSENV